MSNTKRATQETGPVVTTSGKRKTTKADRSPLTIDGTRYFLIRPKAALMGQVANVFDTSRPWDAGERGRVLLQYVAMLLPYIERAPSETDAGTRAQLETRLSDPEDDLDLEDLLPAFIEIMEGWFSPRPTGRPGGSSPRPRAPRSGGSAASTR